MIAKVTLHTVKPGKMEEAKKQVIDNTKPAKDTGALAARYMMLSHSDPSRLTTVTIWKDKKIMDDFTKKAMAKIGAGENPWAKIDSDEYDVVQLV